MAASHLAVCPERTCKAPVTSFTADLVTCMMALPIILLNTSPIPIGLTPGHLSMAINLHAVKAFRP